MYYTYILLSLKDRNFHIGFTGDLKRRLTEHQAGKNISTKPGLPLKLIYYEAHLSKTDAERREQYFKTTKGKSALRQMSTDSLAGLRT
ncbi:MAG: GIY-YIG nuclease family protein [Sedimentisphaerales bacterium]|nr:GIY-YIG nuclease family protein [Sedimentisphaerales bacterium]